MLRNNAFLIISTLTLLLFGIDVKIIREAFKPQTASLVSSLCESWINAWFDRDI